VHAVTTDTKPSNPKEAFGDAKMPLGLVPDTAIVEENLAFLEGALKYGQYNWRIAGVKASTYNRALRRHLKKWWNGQDRDPATQVLELASIRACCGIMIDAIACGMFTDDRPPRADMEGTLARAAQVASHLKQLFKDHHPPQYTELEHAAPARAEKAQKSNELVERYRGVMNAGRTPPAYVGTGLVPAGTTAVPGKDAQGNEKGAWVPSPAHDGMVWTPAPLPKKKRKRNPTSRKRLMAAIHGR
jgi:hypothetical protein